MRGVECFRGIVKGVSPAGVSVEVPSRVRGYVYGPCQTSTHDVIAEGMQVLCVFVDGSDWDLVVVGVLKAPETTGYATHAQHTTTSH